MKGLLKHGHIFGCLLYFLSRILLPWLWCSWWGTLRCSGWPSPSRRAAGCRWCFPGPGDANYLRGSPVWPMRGPWAIRVAYNSPSTELVGRNRVSRGLLLSNFKRQKKWQKASQLEVESGVFVSYVALEAVLAVCSLEERRGASSTPAKEGPEYYWRSCPLAWSVEQP